VNDADEDDARPPTGIKREREKPGYQEYNTTMGEYAAEFPALPGSQSIPL